jgi:hypothetical protein
VDNLNVISIRSRGEAGFVTRHDFFHLFSRLGVAPFACLRDLIARIAAHPKSRIADLLPDYWNAVPLVTPAC